MIRVATFLVAILMLAGCQSAPPEPVASQETSPGGLAFTLIRVAEAEKVAIKIAWATDHAYREGVSQAVPYIGAQLLLAGGADGFDAGAVAERFADLGAAGRLDSTPEHIIGTLSVPARHRDETLVIANAHLAAPTFDEEWLARIREGLSRNLQEAQAQPAMLAGAVARAAILGEHPLRAALDLAPGEFAGATRQAVADWHARTFTRNPAAAVVAGDLSAAEAGAALDTLLAGLPARASDPRRSPNPDFTPRRILLHAPEAKTTQLLFLAPLPPTREGSEFEDLLLVQALGGGEQSVLFEAIRTELRAAYAFGAGMAGYDRDHRFLVMAGSVEASALAEVERVAREAYAAFREAGPSGALADRKAPLTTELAAARRSPERLANSALLAKLDGHPGTLAVSLGALLDEVDEASMVRRLADAFPAPDDFLVIAVTPDPNALPGACAVKKPVEAMACRRGNE